MNQETGIYVHTRTDRNFFNTSRLKTKVKKNMFGCGLPTMFTKLRLHRLRWLGHDGRMKYGRISKDILYEELIAGNYNRYHDACKRYMNIDLNKQEELVMNSSSREVTCN